LVVASGHGDHDLFTMRTDGSKQYLITRNDMFDGYPSFSPDGTWIVVARDTGLTRLNASGSQAKILVPIQDLASNSSDWQPLPCTISGTDGPDELIGTTGNDVICAGAGDDVIDALGGDDVVLAGGGTDPVYGREGNDIVAGAHDADVLRGQAGDDRITGDGAKDIHDGGPGTDYLFAWDRAGGDSWSVAPGRIATPTRRATRSAARSTARLQTCRQAPTPIRSSSQSHRRLSGCAGGLT
jgi:Ca2+-binding RTX toxin-like protein